MLNQLAKISEQRYDAMTKLSIITCSVVRHDDLSLVLIHLNYKKNLHMHVRNS